MAEQANYTLEARGPAPPANYHQPLQTAPIAELDQQQPHPTTASPNPEIQLQSLPPQDHANAPVQSNPTTQPFDPYSPDPQMYPPQMYPPQDHTTSPQPSHYPTAVPLHSLHRTPQVVDCPACKQREMTRVEAVTGNSTHAWAAVLCCCACIGCIPYFVAGLKDVDHICGKCGSVLATYHNSGHIEVHQNPVPK
ncbi:LITAF-like zinc ribbon domain-containing protein [Aspergillus egyptiacus]|nr:LITAF-like zinc ribbon domain-containing protein [Aspergillus egyptiacus]